MTKSALDITADVHNLSNAWQNLYSKTSVRGRLVTGVDKISIFDFKAKEKETLLSISKSIKNKNYKFSPLSPKFVPKSDGGIRVICVPTTFDRIVQRALSNTLFDLGYSLNNSVNHGFVRKKSVKTAINKAIQVRDDNPWVFKVDIAAFFDKLDRGLLVNKIKKEIKHRSLHDMLIASASLEISAYKSEKRKIYDLGIVQGIGIRQGMPLSPFFANLYLKEFDEFVEREGLSVIRYADDIVGFESSQNECFESKKKCEAKLLSIGLSIKDEKTVIASPNETVSFLGLGIACQKSRYKAIVTDVQLKKIAERISQYSNLEFCVRRGVNLKNVLIRLDQLVYSYETIYSEACNKSRLVDVVKSSKEKALKDLFRNNFNIDYSKLSKDKKKFLGMYSLS